MSYYDYSTFYLDQKTKREVLEQINRIRKQVNEIEDVFTGELEGVVRRVLNEGDILEDYLHKNDFYDFKDEIINQVDVINGLIDVLYERFEDYYTKDEVDILISTIDLSDYYTKDETYSKQEVDQAISDVSTGDVDLSDYYTKDETDSIIYRETDYLAPKIDPYFFSELKPWNLVEGNFRFMDDIADDWEIMIDSEEMEHVPGAGIYLPSWGDDPNLKPINLHLNNFVGDVVSIYLKGDYADSPVVRYHILDDEGSILQTEDMYINPYDDEVGVFETEFSFIVEDNMFSIELEVYGFLLEYVVISNSLKITPYYPYDPPPDEYLPRLKDGVADKDESVLGRMVRNMNAIMEHISLHDHGDDE